MTADMETILKRIVSKVKNEGLIQIKHIHKNSFGYVIEYYSLDNGRNYTLTLNDILMVLDLGMDKLENDENN